MVTINNYDELLTYLNGLGIVHPSKLIGWRQQDLCFYADTLKDLAKEYPFTLHYFRSRRRRLRYTFKVNGRIWELPMDARSKQAPREYVRAAHKQTLNAQAS